MGFWNSCLRNIVLFFVNSHGFSAQEEPYVDRDAFQAAVFVQEGGRLKFPSVVPKEVSDMLYCCWNSEPRDRPDFEQLYNYFNAIQIQ